MSYYQKAHFLLSVARLNQLPPDQGTEVVFIGRSNAGKSSVLNKLTHHKNLARVSKMPGRTQFINLFALDEHRRLGDLPGYGYARVPDETRERWIENLDVYFQTRECLKGLVLVMDIRHPLQEIDKSILEGSSASDLPVHILLNKADKLTPNELRKTVPLVKSALEVYGKSVTVQIFSALKGDGVKELQAVLNLWFDL